MRETLEKTETREWAVMENGGQQIFGVLHRPLFNENPPVVVILHGFASSKHGSNRCYVSLAESLAREGIASFRFDFRGSGDSEGNLSEISLEDLVSDALHVLENLEALEGLDTERVALFGASLGGTIALLAASRFRKVKTLALWAPVASGELWYQDFLRANPHYLHADPQSVLSTYQGIPLSVAFREQFAALSAPRVIPELDSIPILHMHGEKDKVIPIGHQEAFNKGCHPSFSNFHFIKYPDGEHSLGFSPSFLQIVSESVSWFQRHL